MRESSLKRIGDIPTNKEELREYGLGALKGLIGAIPYAGTFINEVVFETRSRIKQQRLMRFFELISDSLTEDLDGAVSLEDLDKGEIGDVFEQICLRVARTSSERKLHAFKAILCSQFVKGRQSGHTHKFIQITEALSDSQLGILAGARKYFSDKHFKLNEEYQQTLAKIKQLDEEYMRGPIMAHAYAPGEWGHKYRRKVTTEHERADFLKKELEAFKDAMKPDMLGVSPEDFVIETQDLVAKGLVVDISNDTGIFQKGETFTLTALGTAYVDYVLASC